MGNAAVVGLEVVPEPVIAKCGCGRSYTAKAWAKLPSIGIQNLGGLRLEMRNCPCRSTISVECCSSCNADYAGCEGCDGVKSLEQQLAEHQAPVYAFIADVCTAASK